MDPSLLINLHLPNSRQGPGDASETQRAWNLIPVLPLKPKIADIGCGSGAQTLTLAQLTAGHITAVDLFPEFLARLEQDAQEAGVADRISTLSCSMEALPFEAESFDVIWSEGAIYSMGFENGVQQWRQYLKPGGYLAVSEISWLTDSRPAELEQFWLAAYPEIGTVEEKIAVMEKHGYELMGHFVLPPSCWLENYYAPLEARFDTYLEEQGHSEEVRAVVASEKEEIQLYRRFKEFYSYGFYVAKKRV
jgi:SAM-dependent methyltransferase